MSQPPSRGNNSSRSRARGGRNRGKSMRARGSARGLRIPPEYLAQYIAQKEGRDPHSIPDVNEDEMDEEEVKAFYAKFASRPLEDNSARYEDVPVEGADDKEEEDDTKDILERRRAKELSEVAEAPLPGYSKSQKVIDDEDDVDHALTASLRQIQLKTKGKGTLRVEDDQGSGKGKLVQIEWSEELEEMKREKADAESRRALKERFKSIPHKDRGFKPRNTVAVPTSKAASTNPDMGQLEEFLDDLLS